jgi:hypothetical protein
VGSCHDKKSERVGNSASTQLVGFCYDKKSEQVTCSEQEQDAKHPSKIYDPSNTKSSTNNLRQCQTFVKNVSIDSWQCRMEIKVGNRASTQLVGSCHDEKSERAGCIASTQQDSTINGLVSHIELTELISSVIDGHMNYFQQGDASHFNDACIHRLIVVSVSEGARQVAPAQLAASFDSNLYRPGDVDSSQLIVYIISAKRASKLIVIYFKIPLCFNDKYRIFCEGEWEQQVGNISLAGYTSRISLIGHTGLVGLISFFGFGFFGVNGLIGINSLIGPNDLFDHIGLVGYIGLVRRIDLVDYIGLFGHNGLVGRTLSFIGLGLVGYIGLSFIGLSGLSGISGLIGQISLIDLSASWNHWPINLIGVIGFGLIASSASAVSLARRLIGLVGLVGLLTHRPFLDSLATALIAAKTKISWQLKQAAALGVATVRLSATKIANAASTYYLIASSFHTHSLVREKMWWWLALARKKMWWWIASFGESYHGDVLQHAKQLFSLRLPQMTKY